MFKATEGYAQEFFTATSVSNFLLSKMGNPFSMCFIRTVYYIQIKGLR